jgi:hypothetical protein
LTSRASLANRGKKRSMAISPMELESHASMPSAHPAATKTMLHTLSRSTLSVLPQRASLKSAAFFSKRLRALKLVPCPFPV